MTENTKLKKYIYGLFVLLSMEDIKQAQKLTSKIYKELFPNDKRDISEGFNISMNELIQNNIISTAKEGESLVIKLDFGVN